MLSKCNLVGYTMRDIRYKWNEGPNSVGVSHEVSLPQFKVLGHRQRASEISLTTGIFSLFNSDKTKKKILVCAINYFFRTNSWSRDSFSIFRNKSNCEHSAGFHMARLIIRIFEV